MRYQFDEQETSQQLTTNQINQIRTRGTAQDAITECDYYQCLPQPTD